MDRILKIQQLMFFDFLEMFPGNFCTMRSRFEISSIFFRIDRAAEDSHKLPTPMANSKRTNTSGYSMSAGVAL